MATYKSSLCSANPKVYREELGLNCVVAEYTHSSGAALTTGDVVQMVPVPKGATVVDCRIYVQSGFNTLSGCTAAAQTGAIIVGDGSSGSRYINKTDSGANLQSGGVVSMNSKNKSRKGPYTYTSAADTIDITLVSGPTPWASTSKYLRLSVWYVTNRESISAVSTFAG